MTLAVELEVAFRFHHSRQQASVVLLRLVAGHFTRFRRFRKNGLNPSEGTHAGVQIEHNTK